jgi:AraC family transcriptional regulator of adaptative response / DNA-3-methyladenine glycosylase II
LEIPGIGPWTTEYIAMRALADTDAFPATDLGVLRGLAARGGPGARTGAAGVTAPAAPLTVAPMPVRAASVVALAERWRPWRAYAVMHLWAAAGGR